MEFKKALERIKDALMQENETSYKDWRTIFSELAGSNDLETIANVQKFIKENFSFEIQLGAEGYAYFGKSGATTINSDIFIYQCVDAIVQSSPNKYGYISSTQAGKLFNDKWFNVVLNQKVVKMK